MDFSFRKRSACIEFFRVVALLAFLPKLKAFQAFTSNYAQKDFCTHGRSGNIPCRSAAFDSPVVTTEWLEDHIDDVKVVDIRGKVRKLGGTDESGLLLHQYEALDKDYWESHIPGAVFVDWTKDIAKEVGGVKAQLKPRDEFITAMEERGIGGDTSVVVYDSGSMLFATRFWWAMKVYGHQNVAVLDGGWAKWQAEERETSNEGMPCPLKAHQDWNIPEESCMPEILSTAEDVLQKCVENSSGPQLVDARGAVQFRGEERRANRAGRIPGSISLPYKSLLEKREGYTVLKSKEALQSTLEQAGVDIGKTTIAYCNGGVASTVVLLALHLLGNDFWSNYDGSWNEWGNEDELPIET